ncbi:Histidine kinase [Seminavis robusta]|uniref:Histidine kinase n=1 Tax=Seminavis robusta TaxID=568900 RepID=A0A9N8H9R4_9STRA|nr:Histidine kinase [Seminavis robusta]|eukprot:Sro124_g059960.1 Histidine kinase (1085) ;mRNA; f:75748-79148
MDDSRRSKKRLRIPLVPRLNEEIKIQEALGAVRDEGWVQVVLVGGSSGEGKTTLVSQALRGTRMNQCALARTKYDQRAASTDTAAPFEALRLLVADLAASVMSIPDVNSLTGTVQSLVAHKMPEDQTKTLTAFAPTIKALLLDSKGPLMVDDSSICISSNTIEDLDTLSKDSLTLLTAALQTFIWTVSTVCPVVLHLDDIHWCCDSSLEILKTIALDPQLTSVLLVGTFRTQEVTANPNFAEWRTQLEGQFQPNDTKLSSKKRKFQTIQLESLTQSQIQQLLQEATKQDGLKIQQLAVTVHQFTHGNPFFVRHFLERLQDDGLLVHGWSSFQWNWDLETIKSQSSIEDNVVQTLTSRMHKLPEKVQAVLGLASCFGAKFDARAMHATKSVLKIEDDAVLEDCLSRAKEGEFLIQIDNQCYRFAHDMILLAAEGFQPKDPELLRQYNLTIGTCLLENKKHKRLLQEDNSIYFASVDKMNMGTDVQRCRAEQKIQLARWNYQAARAAARLSAFAPASRYRWTSDEDCYELVVKLYTLLARATYCLGENEKSIAAAQQVLDHARSYQDKQPCLATTMQAREFQKDTNALISFALDMLQSLGERLPDKPSTLLVWLSYRKMKSRLGSMSNDAILSLPLMNDAKQECILILLKQLIMPLYQIGREGLSIVVAWRMIRITLTHGIAKSSPECFANAASFFSGPHSHDIEIAHRLCILTEQIIEKRLGGLDENTANIHHVLFNGGKWWREPVPKCLDCFIASYKTSMRFGKVGAAFRSSCAYQVNYFYSGLQLEPLLKDVERFLQQYIEYYQPYYFFIISPLWQCLLNLTGRDPDPLNMEDGTAMAKRRALEKAGSVVTGQQSIQSYKMQIAYYLGDLPTATEIAETLWEIKLGIMGGAFWFFSRRFILGMIFIANYRQTRKMSDKRKAEKQLKIFRKVVKKAAINLVHKLQIMEAEMSAAQGRMNHDAVLQMYNDAIVSASRVGFLQDAALANYLCFQYIKSNNIQVHLAHMYFNKSCVLWTTWGALAVTESLSERHPEMLASGSMKSSLDSMGVRKEMRGASLRGRPRFDPSLAVSHRNVTASTESLDQ